jgi:hypothetical protein
MQFLMMVKSRENTSPPPPALMEAIEAGRQDAVAAGAMLDTGGLAPTSHSTCVRVENGRVFPIDGPFTEAKEVVGGYAFMEFPTKDDAVQGATWLMELHRQHWPGWEGEVEVRQIFRGDCGARANQ